MLNPRAGVQHAVVLGDALVGIGEDRVVEVERLGELGVLFGGVDAGGEISDFEVLERLAVFLERLAFLGAAAGERLGEPGDHDRGLPFVLLERVGLAVGRLEREGRGLVADLQLIGDRAGKTERGKDAQTEHGRLLGNVSRHRNLLALGAVDAHREPGLVRFPDRNQEKA